MFKYMKERLWDDDETFKLDSKEDCDSKGCNFLLAIKLEVIKIMVKFWYQSKERLSRSIYARTMFNAWL